MRILLAQPPQADPAQPYTSLSILSAAWRQAGLSVDVVDMNVDFFNYLCEEQTLTGFLAEAKERIHSAASLDVVERRGLEQALASADWLIPMTTKALKTLRHPEMFFQPDHYAWAFRTLKRTLSTVSAIAYPGQVSLQSFKTAHSYLSSHGILAARDDWQSNLFLRFCENRLLERFRRWRPDILALSVTFQTQMIPAWTLAGWVKRHFPFIRIVMGGRLSPASMKR